MANWNDLERIVDEFTVPNFVCWLSSYVHYDGLRYLERRLSTDNPAKIKLAESRVRECVLKFRDMFGDDSVFLEPEYFRLLYVHNYVSSLAACDELIDREVFLEGVRKIVESPAPFEERLEEISAYHESLYLKWFGRTLDVTRNAGDKTRLVLLERLAEVRS